jgi:hypothetical protein
MWKRRDLIGLLGAGAATITLLPASEGSHFEAGQDDTKHAALLKSCREACAGCAEECNKAFHHCLEEAARGKAKHAEAAQTIIDCAEFCELSASLLSRQSALLAVSCQACAAACARCAAVCAPFDIDLVMKMCVDACQRCEESCRSMIGAHGSKSPL